MEGGRREEAYCAEAEGAGRSRSSEGEARDAMDAAAAGSGGGLRAMVDHCRSAEHEGLAGAEQGYHMVWAQCW